MQPRGILVTPDHVKRAGLPDRAVDQTQPLRHTTLWEENPDVTALLQTTCRLAGINLDVVSAAEPLLGAAAQAQSGDFLIIDCSWALPDDIVRCTLVVTKTAVPVYIIYPRKDLVDELKAVARGELLWCPPESTGLTLLDKLRLRQAMATVRATSAPSLGVMVPAPRPTPLTDREQEVYRLVAQGLTNREIGERLYIGCSTVKTNVARIKEKLGLSTRGHLIASYHRSGGATGSH